MQETALQTPPERERAARMPRAQASKNFKGILKGTFKDTLKDTLIWCSGLEMNLEPLLKRTPYTFIKTA